MDSPDHSPGGVGASTLEIVDRTSGKRWLDALARRYSGALFSFFDRRVQQKADVPDLVQDVFLRLARSRSTQEIEQVEHYLFKTAANTLKDHHRHSQARQSHQHDPFVPNMHGGIDFSSADILEAREALAKVQDILGELPERTRTVFVLKALEQQKTAMVADTLGISSRAVEKHYAKALARVSHALIAYRD